MKRVDAAGATVNNLFTVGNPALSVPATTVDDTIMNAIQEEICNVIEDDGQTLDQTNVNLTQLLTAINNKVKQGGVQLAADIDNNKAALTNVTGLVFNKTLVKSAIIEYDIHRATDTVSSELDEAGTMRLLYDPVNDNWRISQSTSFDDAGVIFTCTSAGQVQYTSTNIAGSNYVGKMRMIIRTIKQPTP